MQQKKVDRINELYKKQKTVGLTPTEKEEQTKLRKEYVGLVRKNFTGTLNSVKIKDMDGNITALKDRKKS